MVMLMKQMVIDMDDKTKEVVKNIENTFNKLESMLSTYGVVHGSENVIPKHLRGSHNKDSDVVITIKV